MADNTIEELLKGVTQHPGVRGFIIVSADGIPIRHSFDDADRALAVQYAGLLQHMVLKTRSAISLLDTSNDLVFLRLRSKKHEILVAPERDYLLIVIQEPVA